MPGEDGRCGPGGRHEAPIADHPTQCPCGRVKRIPPPPKEPT